MFSSSRRHRIPYLPLVMLMLAQLACYSSCLVGLFYDEYIIDHCDQWGIRYGDESSACYDALEDACPDSDFTRYPYDSCINGFIGSPPPADCTDFRILSPRDMFPNADPNQVVRWPQLEANRYQYRIEVSLDGINAQTLRAESPDSAVEIFVGTAQTTTIKVTLFEAGLLNCSDTVTVSRYVPPAPTFDCSVFRLTAPLEGLANGVNTFYWDALPSASGYALTVTDASGATLASLSTAAGTTNATVDLSSTTTGDGGVLTVTVQALVGGNAVCTDTRSIQRAAFQPPSSGPVCGDGICVMPDEAACLADCS
jgi:hypothetical protein